MPVGKEILRNQLHQQLRLVPDLDLESEHSKHKRKKNIPHVISECKRLCQNSVGECKNQQCSIYFFDIALLHVLCLIFSPSLRVHFSFTSVKKNISYCFIFMQIIYIFLFLKIQKNTNLSIPFFIFPSICLAIYI